MRTFLLGAGLLWASLCAIGQDYARDNLFNYNLPTSTINVRDLAVLPDKKIMIAGEFHAYGSSFSYSKVQRLLPTGAPDPSFVSPAIAGGRVNAMVIQPWDNAVVIAGAFTSVGGVARGGIARLQSNGSLDATFNPGSGIAGGYAGDLIIWSLAVRNDADAGKRRIIAGGQFTTYNGVAVANGNGGGLVQLRTDGSLDVAALPKVEGGPVYCVAVDDNGRILAGGEFYQVNGADRWRIARINVDGTTDATFAGYRWDGCNSSVTLVKANGSEVYVGGFFTHFNGTASRGLVRLLPNGTRDATFNVGTGFTGSNTALCSQNLEVKSMAIQTDGKLVVGGNFTAANGAAAYRIARLLADGSVDASCTTGTGFDQCVNRVVFQGTDDSLLVAGFFTSFRDEVQGSVIRIRKPPLPLLLPVHIDHFTGRMRGDQGLLEWQVGGLTEGSALTLLRSTDGRRFAAVRTWTGSAVPATWSDPQLPAGRVFYKLRVTNEAGQSVESAIVELERPSEVRRGLYPNPFSSLLHLVLPEAVAGAVLLRFTAADGRSWSYRAMAQGRLLQVEAEGLPPGTYGLQAWSARGELLYSAVAVRAAR
ncbi:delta-60 repeat domain-containing protein [Flaviaesturariibacter amylovorans]|uniref:T9SS type A sorting domain-containing protein n=1 Tax=Flaviaesturariibacter amylovorans TaxID=1084520 RepID=A0ABP8H143_9BACT